MIYRLKREGVGWAVLGKSDGVVGWAIPASHGSWYVHTTAYRGYIGEEQIRGAEEASKEVSALTSLE